MTTASSIGRSGTRYYTFLELVNLSITSTIKVGEKIDAVLMHRILLPLNSLCGPHLGDSVKRVEMRQMYSGEENLFS